MPALTRTFKLADTLTFGRDLVYELVREGRLTHEEANHIVSALLLLHRAATLTLDELKALRTSDPADTLMMDESELKAENIRGR